MVDGYLGTMTTEDAYIAPPIRQPSTRRSVGGSFFSNSSRYISSSPRSEEACSSNTKTLENEKRVYSGQRHVPGAKQRRKVYGLTTRGKERAGSLLRIKFYQNL